METNYKWKIVATPCVLSKRNLEKVVNVVHWRLEASNENCAAETYGATSIPEPNEEGFTPYESLTKDQVVSWVVEILSIIPAPIDGVEQKSQLDKIKENLDNDLYLQANPVEVNLPLPFEN